MTIRLLILVLTVGFSIQSFANDEAKRILFVGNSFSYFNNGLHNHTANLVRGNNQWQVRKDRFRLLTLSAGRFREQVHLVEPILSTSRKKWDYVVLQAHSRTPLLAEEKSNFSKLSKELISVVRDHGAQPVLFMTWAYKNSPEMTKGLYEAYKKVADAEGVRLVPVGLAFEKIQRDYSEIDLYVRDFNGTENGELVYKKAIKHPSLAGTYLAACVFYASFYGASPEGNAYSAGLSEDVARTLQKVAWEIVSKH
ncbi:hypothetical protein QGN29_09365 [Temperatibacter marinus]|uniref:DUF4886 domain-containing protein n=1 Tax=Temperatibacter marinus TaxID=1456591 RepID=A0AA52H851_9PROT|nr:DUF4886 domain-containing protein [Temperatibacter marinus]WND01761.1 hypothetical protein QGN29_09365 [Temperatibacter marinus]